MDKKQKLNKQRQDFLLTFFDKDEYIEKEINGFWLIKQWNGETKHWQVAIYSKDSFKKKNKD